MDGLNIAGRLRIVAERLAQDTDGFGQRRVRDEGVFPDGVDEFLLRYHRAGARDEQIENAQHTWRQRDFALSVAQQSIGPIKDKWTEADLCWLRWNDQRFCGKGHQVGMLSRLKSKEQVRSEPAASVR